MKIKFVEFKDKSVFYRDLCLYNQFEFKTMSVLKRTIIITIITIKLDK